MEMIPQVIQLESKEDQVVEVLLVIIHLMVEILVVVMLLQVAVLVVVVLEELGVIPQIEEEPMEQIPQLVDPILLVHGLYLPLFLLAVDHLTH